MIKPIVLILNDSSFEPPLASLVHEAGYRPLFATNETALTQAMVQAPVLGFVDLSATDFNWERLVRFVKGPAKKNNHVPLIGIASTDEPRLRKRAEDAGCTFIASRSAICTDITTLIEKNIWRVDAGICANPLPSLALKGVEEFNQARFFECHETLEDAWNDEPGTIRMLYQGILQIAVGYLHITRKNWRGAVKVLERGIPKAAHFRPVCQGIDVADLITQAQTVRARLLDLGPARIAEFDTSTFPKIRVNGKFPGL